MPLKHPHWQYYIGLETEFIETIHFVELATENHSTHSIAFTKLLLAACAETEIVLKQLCKRISPASNVENIGDLATVITGAWPKFTTIEVFVPQYQLDHKPWEHWKLGQPPQWWTAHNHLKHDRGTSFQKANQGNALHSLMGLFASLLYLYETEINAGNFQPEPKLLHYPGMFPEKMEFFHQMILPKT